MNIEKKINVKPACLVFAAICAISYVCAWIGGIVPFSTAACTAAYITAVVGGFMAFIAFIETNS